MNLLFVVLLTIASAAYAGDWWSGSPKFNTSGASTAYIITTGDDTTKPFALSPSMGAQLQMIGTAAGDSSAVTWYPVFASKGSYSECGAVPLANFKNQWGTTDSTEYVGIFDVSVDSVFATGANIVPDATCPCAAIVVKGLALNDSSYVRILLDRYTQ